jgi:hypothetical protein
MNEHLIQPEPPEPLTEETCAFWREVGRELIKGSLSTIDETAKQVIGVAGILEGLYFHAIAFGDLMGKVKGNFVLFIYLLPILWLLLSLAAGLLVFYPHRYLINIHSSEGSRKAYHDMLHSKLLMLRLASLCLFLGVASFLPAIYLYLKG